MTGEIKKSDLRAPDYVGHMIQACDRILEYTYGMDKAQFIEKYLIQDAVLRNIIVLGEATSNLYECVSNLEEKYPDIPWIDIYGMRNRVSHGYFFINNDLVWEVATERVPELKRQLLLIINNIER